MIFTTPEFALFLAAFLPIYAASRGRGRKWALLAASYLFYAKRTTRTTVRHCSTWPPRGRTNRFTSTALCATPTW